MLNNDKPVFCQKMPNLDALYVSGHPLDIIRLLSFVACNQSKVQTKANIFTDEKPKIAKHREYKADFFFFRHVSNAHEDVGKSD